MLVNQMHASLLWRGTDFITVRDKTLVLAFHVSVHIQEQLLIKEQVPSSRLLPLTHHLEDHDSLRYVDQGNDP